MRLATINDAEAIARVHVVAYEEELAQHVEPSVLVAAQAQRLSMWRSLLAQPPADQAVFVEGEQGVIGFVSAGPDRDPASGSEVGEVYALFVEPSQWRRGVGASLMASAVDHIRSLGCTEARLWVLDKNTRAQAFYFSRGWADLGVVREDARGRFLRLTLPV